MQSLSLPAKSPPSAPHCRILIADDHPVVRASLRCLLETTANITVIAEAEDGEDALAKIAQFKPDVALMDVAMPKLNGIEATRRVADASHRTRVLALTAHEDGHHVRDALAAGAAGFVPKSAAAAELVAAIHAVAAGGQYVHASVVNATLETLLDRGSGDKSELSEREGQVLRLIAHGFGNKEIADRLSVSVKTVETYKARGLEKIGAKSRVDLMRFAATHGWFDS